MEDYSCEIERSTSKRFDKLVLFLSLIHLATYDLIYYFNILYNSLIYCNGLIGMPWRNHDGPETGWTRMVNIFLGFIRRFSKIVRNKTNYYVFNFCIWVKNMHCYVYILINKYHFYNVFWSKFLSIDIDTNYKVLHKLSFGFLSPHCLIIFNNIFDII